MFRRSLNSFAALFVAVVFVFVLSVTVATPAFAQKSPLILVVDQQRVLTESKVGKSIASQVKSISVKADTEVKTEITRIKEEAEKLKAQQDTDQKKAMIDQQVAASVQQIGKVGFAKLQQAQNVALSKVTPELEVAMKLVYDRRKATLMLEKQSTLFNSNATDVTDEVIKELDKKIQTVKVESVKIFADKK